MSSLLQCTDTFIKNSFHILLTHMTYRTYFCVNIIDSLSKARVLYSSELITSWLRNGFNRFLRRKTYVFIKNILKLWIKIGKHYMKRSPREGWSPSIALIFIIIIYNICSKRRSETCTDQTIHVNNLPRFLPVGIHWKHIILRLPTTRSPYNRIRVSVIVASGECCYL